MAIKERKQITGTTAQIQAYAGHEGQIVWDKEKKTFVGMSGTAGENYPLAQQAYVDEGLAGKEDKGVCLPLSGGTVTGNIITSYKTKLKKNSDSSEMLILGGTGLDDGGWLGLYGQNFGDGRKGGFTLTAKGKTLRGTPSGALTWDGQKVEAVTSRGGDGRYGFIRYTNGIQICWSMNAQTNSAGGTSFDFPVPFASAPYVIASLQGSAASTENWSFVYEEHSSATTGANIWLMSNGAPSPGQTIKCFAFGLWK